MKYLFFSLLLLSYLLSLTSSSYAQERTLTGVVTTLESVAVVNAEVKVVSSKAMVLTDSLGQFEVSCLPNDKIIVSAKRFKSQKVKVDEHTKEALIDLTFNPTEKNVELAVGYGYIKEEDKSFAISSVRNNSTNNFNMNSSMLEVILNSSTSVAYDGVGFIIRGGSSLLGSNYALIILDGREANFSQLISVPPVDVKSVDILKGSASAIYGTRGANGVIIVSTK